MVMQMFLPCKKVDAALYPHRSVGQDIGVSAREQPCSLNCCGGQQPSNVVAIQYIFSHPTRAATPGQT